MCAKKISLIGITHKIYSFYPKPLFKPYLKNWERVIKILTSQKIREMIAIYKTCKAKTLDVYVWWHCKKEIERLEAELTSLGDTDES